jgi:hypothetical protein
VTTCGLDDNSSIFVIKDKNPPLYESSNKKIWIHFFSSARQEQASVLEDIDQSTKYITVWTHSTLVG